MKLDSEQHRTLLLAVINEATFKGNAVEVVAELKEAIATAEVAGAKQE